jgi:hypothetical protein
MAEQEKLTLQVASAEHVSDSKAGWKRYTITTPTGESHNVLLQPDATYEPKEGDNITFFKGSYNSWVLDRDSLGEGSAPVNGSPATRTTRGKSARDKYWEGKTSYENEVRDPKIEFQTYFRQVIDLYASAIPTLKKPPETTQDLDAYIDDAYAKAEAIFARRQRAFAKKEDDKE